MAGKDAQVIQSQRDPVANIEKSQTHDRQTILRSENDSDCGAELHRGSSGGRHVGDLVSEHSHDVVSVCSETEYEGEGTNNQHPNWYVTVLALDGS